jgi:hypothetical protein
VDGKREVVVTKRSDEAEGKTRGSARKPRLGEREDLKFKRSTDLASAKMAGVGLSGNPLGCCKKGGCSQQGVRWMLMLALRRVTGGDQESAEGETEFGRSMPRATPATPAMATAQKTAQKHNWGLYSKIADAETLNTSACSQRRLH